jgi:precorrin-2 methylase
MEHLRENSHGFLSKLLEIEIVPGIDAMKAFMLTQGTEHIGSELLSIMPEAARTNLQILTWNKIVNSLGVSSIFKHGKSSFFSGFS